MNDNLNEMTFGGVIPVDVVHPVLPCAIDMAISCAQCDLDLAVRDPPVEQLLWNYLDGFPGVISAHPPSPQTDGRNGVPRRQRVTFYAERSR